MYSYDGCYRYAYGGCRGICYCTATHSLENTWHYHIYWYKAHRSAQVYRKRAQRAWAPLVASCVGPAGRSLCERAAPTASTKLPIGTAHAKEHARRRSAPRTCGRPHGMSSPCDGGSTDTRHLSRHGHPAGSLNLRGIA